METDADQNLLNFIGNTGGGGGRRAEDLHLMPLDATFRDSTKAPLHSWFPYLEGYSPRFVRRVFLEYFSDADRIIEPFGGSGTTPIVLGQMGVECAYAEANPAMATVIRIKLDVLSATEEQRKELSRELRTLSNRIEGLLDDFEGSSDLHASYLRVFGESKFFRDKSFQQILKMRSLVDGMIDEHPLLGGSLLVAVLSSLIPTSLLKRAGDLRYRTSTELSKGVLLPAQAVCSVLRRQSTELLNVEGLQKEALFAASLAKDIADGVEGEWDGVVTSPPYLNGTNYIRNSRLELWFLREVLVQEDLRRLRNTVITSGINDVHRGTIWDSAVSSVRRVVSELEANAYDKRIAKMAGGYFHDMREFLSNLKACLRPRAILCIDIGDSMYAGVHVPTDDLLVDVAESLGYSTIERINLRCRRSKGGAQLRQQLLVFRNGTKSGEDQ